MMPSDMGLESADREAVSKLQVALDAMLADLFDQLADFEQMTADGAEARIGPDLRLSMHEGSGVKARITTHQGDVPIALMVTRAREGPCELCLIPG